MNVKKAVSLALQKNPKGLVASSRWQEKSILSEASEIRWPDKSRSYKEDSIASALNQLIEDQKVFVKIRSYEPIYFWNPKKSSNQFKEFIELKSRIRACNDKLKGHGFNGFKLIKTKPLTWLRMSKSYRDCLLNVEIPLAELENIIQELRARISGR